MSQESKAPTIAIFGCGNMGTALLSGLLASKNAHEPGGVKKVYACVKSQESVNRLKGLFASFSEVEVVKDGITEALHKADCVILGFPPGEHRNILGDPRVAPAVASSKLVISMLAGVTCRSISAILKFACRRSANSAANIEAKIVRALPTIGAQINQSSTLVYEPNGVDNGQIELFRWIFTQVGSITSMPEEIMDTAVAVSATTHALTTTVVDAITDGSVSRGIPRKLALQLAAQNLRSASSLLLEQMTLEELKESMSIPRGITTEAWVHLEKGNVRSAVTESVRRAVDYAQSMNRNGS